jgi:hypothetical protein
MALAVNEIELVDDVFSVENPLHQATISAAGIQFAPAQGELVWRWQLESAHFDGGHALTLDKAAIVPSRSLQTIALDRGPLVEQYVVKTRTIEQRFVLPSLLCDNGQDFVIDGLIHADAEFSRNCNGWLWGGGGASVRLGDVLVFDARGRTLPATMTVTADRTRIVVDGRALASADYPVTIDPEIGTNDARISDMGTDQDTAFNMFQVRSAYNSTNNEFLVVWAGDDNTAPLVDGENEIHGQRIDAATGAELGTNDFRISDMGDDAEATATVRDNFFAIDPHVAYNPTNNEYLVVWAGDDDTSPTVDGENEIYGQRLNAATCVEVGTNDFRISDMGGNGANGLNAQNVALAYNSTNNEYLVVWAGDDDTSPLVNGEFEIYCQRITASTGAEVGTNDMRISDMGDESEVDGTVRDNFGAFNPQVAYNSTNNEFLVVWQADDDTGSLIDNENEIWGQRINGATGAEVGTNDFRISDLGAADGSTTYQASEPDAAYNSTNNEYLVVWRGDDDTAPLVDGEQEVYGQRINALTGVEVGANDFRISDMGDDSEADASVRDNYFVSEPRIAYNVHANEFLVTWSGEDDTSPLVDGEFEAYAQRIDAATGAEVGDNDVRVSDMGNDSEAVSTVRDNFRAGRVEVAYGSTSRSYLITWEGDDDSTNASDNTLVDGENEAFMQFITLPNSDPEITEGASTSVAMDEDGDPTAFSLTLNATDANADTLTWSISSLASDGTASADGTGDSKAIGYAPNQDFNGIDSFVVQVSDGNSGTDTITVSVTVDPVNDAPTITEGDSAGVTMDEDGNPTAFSLTLNATDVESDTLTWSVSSQASDGTASADGTGSSIAVSYAPNADINGVDSFEVQVADGNSGTDLITVNVTLDPANDAPDAVDDTLSVDEDSVDNVLNVLDGDTDIDMDIFTIVAVGATNAGGAATITPGGGSVTYSPAGDYFGTETFTYTVEDGSSAMDTANVTITVDNVNDNPVAVDDVFSVSEDSADNVLDVLSNDNDGPDSGETLTILAVGAADNGGTVTVDSGTQLLYSPMAGANGTETFTYTISDGNGGNAMATVRVDVDNVNDDPVGVDDTFTVAENSSDNVLDVLQNDTDVDVGDLLTVGAAGATDNGGMVTITGDDLSLLYTPAADFSGVEQFSYTVSDGNGGSAMAIVAVTVEAAPLEEGEGEGEPEEGEGEAGSEGEGEAGSEGEGEGEGEGEAGSEGEGEGEAGSEGEGEGEAGGEGEGEAGSEGEGEAGSEGEGEAGGEGEGEAGSEGEGEAGGEEGEGEEGGEGEGEAGSEGEGEVGGEGEGEAGEGEEEAGSQLCGSPIGKDWREGLSDWLWLGLGLAVLMVSRRSAARPVGPERIAAPTTVRKPEKRTNM